MLFLLYRITKVYYFCQKVMIGGLIFSVIISQCYKMVYWLDLFGDCRVEELLNCRTVRFGIYNPEAEINCGIFSYIGLEEPLHRKRLKRNLVFEN